MGLINGVTTNPTLVAKEGEVDFKEHAAKIYEIVRGDVSAEVNSIDTEEMQREDPELAKIDAKCGNQMSLTLDSLKPLLTFRDEGTKVNVTRF